MDHKLYITGSAHPIPLQLQAGATNRWELRITVDGVPSVLTGKLITVDGWTCVEDGPNGATSSGELVMHK